MQYRSIAGDDLASPQPAILFHFNRDLHVHEDAVAGGRDGGGGNIEHEVGLA